MQDQVKASRELIAPTAGGWCRTDFTGAPVKELGRISGFYFDLKPRILTVIAVRRLSQTLMRIRFRAHDDFAGFHTLGPEDHVKLFFDHRSDGTPAMPRIIDGRWSGRNYTFRDYTIRWFDPAQRLLDIDFVLHDHGVAGRWASQAQAGDQLGMLGPRGSIVVADAFPWYVLAGDETALPAIARRLEGLREGVPVTVFVEVDGPASHIELPTRAQATVHWCDRDGAAPGISMALSDAVTAHRFPDTEGFVWAGGEAGGIKPIRRYLKEYGFARNHYRVDGYWRVGTANLDHHALNEDE